MFQAIWGWSALHQQLVVQLRALLEKKPRLLLHSESSDDGDEEGLTLGDTQIHRLLRLC